MRHDLPRAGPGQSIGLLGGSFDPPHAGHVHITREALRRFGLDRVWWLVSPGNPLKSQAPAPLARRLAAARALIRHPRLVVTDVEARLGTRFTAETLQRLGAVYPRVRFVWLMGADNLTSFHLWEDWTWIAESVPMGVLARPGPGMAALSAPAARRFRTARVPGRASRLLPGRTPPAWAFVTIPKVAISSSAIRRRGDWTRRG